MLCKKPPPIRRTTEGHANKKHTDFKDKKAVRRELKRRKNHTKSTLIPMCDRTFVEVVEILTFSA